MLNKISIITPSFNCEKYISETLDSLLVQTYGNWENIIVDDGSSDNTKNIIEEYVKNDTRIKFYDRDRQPKGACSCRNQGVDLCNGRYVIFLDTDDLLEPFCLEQRVKVMDKNSDLDFAIFPSMVFNKVPHDLKLWWNVDKESDELTRQFHQDGLCQGTGVIWRRSAFKRIGQWDETLQLWQDVDLFLRAFIQNYKYKKCFTLPADLHNRRSEESLSHRDFFSNNKTESRIRVLKKSVKLLREFNKFEYLAEAKYITVEIISALSRTGRLSRAREIMNWGFEEKILNKSELFDLQIMFFLRATKLYGISFLSKKVETIEHRFIAKDRTLGILSYEVPISGTYDKH